MHSRTSAPRWPAHKPAKRRRTRWTGDLTTWIPVRDRIDPGRARRPRHVPPRIRRRGQDRLPDAAVLGVAVGAEPPAGPTSSGCANGRKRRPRRTVSIVPIRPMPAVMAGDMIQQAIAVARLEAPSKACSAGGIDDQVNEALQALAAHAPKKERREE